MTTIRITEERYNHQAIDAKWQSRWNENGSNSVKDNDIRPKWYECTMYPYPSGDLHIGHWYAMAPSDTHARFKRMQGYNVLHPMGFDAFGLPAENAAIQRSVHPHTWTMGNIDNMRRQLKSMGAIYDWDKELVTCLPEYYQWNQWIFLQFFKSGLAYRDFAPANWCPNDNTVLANEQVLQDGTCERCGATVIRRNLNQWFFKITEYAEELLDHSKKQWPDKIDTMQTNWIGKSEGVEIDFDISEYGLEKDTLTTFTTRIDTIFGVTFVVMAPEHPLVTQLTTTAYKEDVESYVEQARRQTEIERLSTEKEKTGVFTGSYCINKLNGERIPILVGDYVLSTYGTGIVMGVPAHDQRDFEFANQYGLEIRTVIAPEAWNGEPLKEAYTDVGIQVNSGQFDGLRSEEGWQKIADHITDSSWGRRTIQYRMRDWLISRQRYWGTPIPIIYCEQCGVVPVPEKDLPLLLPEDAEFKPTGESPLELHEEFVNTKCPNCKNPAKRETDTMDTFVDSSWYFLRYPNPNYHTGPFDPDALDKWGQVDQYTGGAEHAVMHLLYARFFIKGLRDLGFLSFDEPFLKLFNQGIILGSDREKMSKSRGNVVAPDDYVEAFGADVVRCFLMFLGPWDQGGSWSDSGINGMARWMNRVWDLSTRNSKTLNTLSPDPSASRNLLRLQHKTIQRVGEDLDKFKFNTALSGLMEYSNGLNQLWEKGNVNSEEWESAISTLLLLMSPMAPHLADELWENSGHKNSIHMEKWPEWDHNLAADDVITLVVQVNGKVRDKIETSADVNESNAQKLALNSPKIKNHTEGLEIRKIIYIPGKLINIVATNTQSKQN